MPYLESALIRKRTQLTNIIDHLEEDLKKARKGNIKIGKTKAGSPRFQYRMRPGDKYYYMSPKDINVIKEIIQRDYNIKVLATAKDQLTHVNRLYNSYDSKALTHVYENTSDIRKSYIKSALFPDDEYARLWQEEKYIRNSYPMQKKYKTMRGEDVRSKSEQTIADRLYKAGIPYRLEEYVYVGNNTYVCPDFTILNVRTREVYYIEHFGMMSDPDYFDDSVLKMNQYYHYGNQFVGHFLMTFENSYAKFDGQVIDDFIRDYFT